MLIMLQLFTPLPQYFMGHVLSEEKGLFGAQTRVPVEMEVKFFGVHQLPRVNKG